MISTKSILLISIILGLAVCHDDHTHYYNGAHGPVVADPGAHTHYYNPAAAPAVAPASPVHTHYYDPSATSAPASPVHTHYYDPSATAAPASNLHTHYYNPTPAPVVNPAPVTNSVVHEHNAVAFEPVSIRPSFKPQKVEVVTFAPPVINRKPLDTRPLQVKRESLPYLPGYKWNNYTMRREE
jgi:hypothetical protein